MSLFYEMYAKQPQASAYASGRVNLLGEHTDYQGGFVLPTAIPQQIKVSLAVNNTGRHNIFSNKLGATRLDLGGRGEGYSVYLAGCFELTGVQEGLDVLIEGEVPSGGLSSSAALEIATLRALRELYKLQLSDIDLAMLGVKVEHEYAGVKCGVMDQVASSLASTQTMLLIDTRSLDITPVSFPRGAELLVIDSGVPRSLAQSGYNQRRSEVEEASRLLGVKELRDIQDVSKLLQLPPLLHKRALHVVTENGRVLQSLKEEAEGFGKLMNASHASLRDNYEVSHPEVDRLVSLLQANPAVYGARMTGAGFGGAVVALVQAGKARAVAEALTGKRIRVVVPESA